MNSQTQGTNGNAEPRYVCTNWDKPLNLYSLVECLTQRRREAESAEKSQKSEGKERYDKKRPGNFFHPIGENNYDTN